MTTICQSNVILHAFDWNYYGHSKWPARKSFIFTRTACRSVLGSCVVGVLYLYLWEINGSGGWEFIMDSGNGVPEMIPCCYGVGKGSLSVEYWKTRWFAL